VYNNNNNNNNNNNKLNIIYKFAFLFIKYIIFLYCYAPWRSKRISWCGRSILLIGRGEFSMTLGYSARGGSCVFEEKTMLLGNATLVKKDCDIVRKIVILW